MSLGKELFIAAHEELVERYLLDHPHATWSEAYEATADAASGHAAEKFADMADRAKDRAKEVGEWPPRAAEVKE